MTGKRSMQRQFAACATLIRSLGHHVSDQCADRLWAMVQALVRSIGRRPRLRCFSRPSRQGRRACSKATAFLRPTTPSDEIAAVRHRDASTCPRRSERKTARTPGNQKQKHRTGVEHLPMSLATRPTLSNSRQSAPRQGSHGMRLRQWDRHCRDVEPAGACMEPGILCSIGEIWRISLFCAFQSVKYTICPVVTAIEVRAYRPKISPFS